ncbi:hypothetical protein CONCODRAFT_68062 [Conidiobolus coronatus NRRL 28638]|uniref:F-box domain-containing protein n=1 Tax=Conidiobolus coronatus (strain ATCC 28846 / CBS 209.66 / NRRL 28638) TaxID=796925 RepID=A0A137PFF0_CONC2|nr:hypothetical protein CONCODRAFT_68062 [Conidiobolus coronatus NRRL 28638]|eukprot:KXN73712.1 hypothetical protein CONCODRAFT_68062 [Conidiobolus coronatus NRRL 28638]
MNKHTIHHLQDYNLTPQHIPSLKTLHYSSNSPLELTNFIDLNPQLKSIRVHQGQISDNTYTKLSSHNQIKQLFIESFEFTRNYIFKLPVIFSLKSLCIRLDDDFDYSMELINAFPNITRFSVKYNYVVDNLNILWFSSKFQKLKYLRLEFVEGLEADDKFDFPKFCELEVLEFICADEGVFNCEELGEGNKLKLIKFYDYPASKGIPIGYKINEVRNWKILSYNDSRVYYKH